VSLLKRLGTDGNEVDILGADKSSTAPLGSKAPASDQTAQDRQKGRASGTTSRLGGGATTTTLPDHRATSKDAVRDRMAADETGPGHNGSSDKDSFQELKRRVQQRLIAELDPRADIRKPDELRRSVETIFNSILDNEGLILTRGERQRLHEAIASEILGLGPIEPLLQDDTITEIMVNGANQVYIERQGRILKTDIRFNNDDHVMRIVDRIVAPLGRRVDESSPMVDARLFDGSRVNVVIPPLSLVGPVVTIRKFSRDPLTIDDLIRFGTMTRDEQIFLEACVKARISMVISGGTGSGKTTTLNVLSSFIPANDRIVTIENAAELQLRQEHVITLESRPPNIEGLGEITIRELVINSLRMRPDRIVVGEVRGAEALDMLQAMNTGHDGSLTTLHSNGPRDALSRLETMVLMAGMELPMRAIREQIASAIKLIVHQERLKDGSRKITNITEVCGIESETITLNDIFLFEELGMEGDRVVGKIRPTGVKPRFAERFERMGIYLPARMFEQ
jgi:pilus assembly protein CpaF